MAEPAKLHLSSVLTALGKVEREGDRRTLGDRKELVQRWLSKVRQALNLVDTKAPVDAEVLAHLDGGRLSTMQSGEASVLHLDAAEWVVWAFRGEAALASDKRIGPGGHVAIRLLDPATRARKLRSSLKVEPGASGMHVWKVRQER
jgi:hypothetical protein